MHNMLFSLGSLFFSILLTIVYFIKAKQTTVDNRIFKTLLVILVLTVISEILAVGAIYYYPDNTLLGDILSRINWILTISWIMNIAFYMLTVGNAYKITSIKSLIDSDKSIRILLFIYVASIIISLFIDFDNFYSKEGAYISGPSLYFMYIVGAIAIITATVGVIRSNKKVPRDKIIPLVIGIIVSITAMALQRIFPMYLMLTSMFTFDTYITYFIFENPDLFLIKQLDLSKEKAEKSDRAKTDFLTNMSNEIKTPINAILGISEGIILDKNFDPKIIKRDASNILSAGNSLLEVINNILDVSKIETDEEQVENQEYDLKSTIFDLRNVIEARIKDSHVKLVIDVNPDIPLKLIGDQAKLYQILLNILSNSAKYTEVGTIKLKLTADMVNNEALLHFRISDTGYGIKKETYDLLMRKLSSLDMSAQREGESTGLGLVITKRLVDIIGGRMWFESEHGAGTTFYVDLRQTIADATPIGNMENTAEDIIQRKYLDCSQYKVLLVDDNKLNLKIVKKIMANYKLQVTTLTSGDECINDIKKGSKYDLIFLDYLMPEINGIEVVHVLKKLDGYDIPPTIVLTANTNNNMKETYLREGFDEYLSIPINITELDKIINKYLK